MIFAKCFFHIWSAVRRYIVKDSFEHTNQLAMRERASKGTA